MALVAVAITSSAYAAGTPTELEVKRYFVGCSLPSPLKDYGKGFSIRDWKKLGDTGKIDYSCSFITTAQVKSELLSMVVAAYRLTGCLQSFTSGPPPSGYSPRTWEAELNSKETILIAASCLSLSKED